MGLDTGSGILFPIAHAKRGSVYPEGEIYVLGQRPAEVPLGHHQPDLLIESYPEPLHQRDVITCGEVAETDELVNAPQWS